jgi:hypothetical protein
MVPLINNLLIASKPDVTVLHNGGPAMNKRGHKKSPDSLERCIAEAVKQARFAYEFSANSYTASAFTACLTVASRFRNKAAQAINPNNTAGLSGLSSGSSLALERPEIHSD